PVEHAEHDTLIRPSRIYIAPPDRHLMAHNGRIRLSAGPKENFARPAIDPLFRSAAIEYGPRAIAVVLTGNLDDGAAGAVAVRACGGSIIVQDPIDSVAPSMPASALRAVPDAVIASLDKVGETIVQALMAPRRPKVMEPHPTQVAAEARISTTGVTSPAELDLIGERSPLTCPDCGGVVWRIGTDAPLRYRCHTGHAFSNLALASAQRLGLEEALWIAIRKAEERATLALAQAEIARRSGDEALAAAAGVEHAEFQSLQESLRRFVLEGTDK
ncbi:chemotaxis protein CheB, partial [Paraburkholderia sp.]|uniref:chemotaxis protein CheB n=1 Tax=Paraburkholderia sp. TaxID=1926495 RepID=UPI002F4037A5